jgi:hypothetical protein
VEPPVDLRYARKRRPRVARGACREAARDQAVNLDRDARERARLGAREQVVARRIVRRPPRGDAERVREQMMAPADVALSALSGRAMR